MKKALLLSVLAFSINAYAQKFYSAAGTKVFSFNTGTSLTTPLGTFTQSTAYQPTGRLVHAGNGELIGITQQSPNLYGAFYKADTSGNAIAVLYEFTTNNKPQSSFVLADNGKLYGLGNTGTSNESAIYSFDPTSNIYTKEYEIIGDANSGIHGGMVKATDGILYGVTQRGGANNAGRIFSYNTATNTYTLLHEFSTSDGINPEAVMIQAANGKLYGVTPYGGTNDKGTLFSFDISSTTYTKLSDFVQAGGEGAFSPLMQASNGILYGTMMAGGSSFQGVLYSFNIATNTYTNLHSFFGTEGYGPRTQPVEGNNGILYGTTNSGGANFRGTIYSFDILNSSYNKIFDGNDTTGNFVCPLLSFESGGTIGIKGNNFDTNLSVYPNPANDLVAIKNMPLNSKLSITDLSGKIVYSSMIISGQAIVNTADYVNGIYCINVESNGSIFSERLILNK